MLVGAQVTEQQHQHGANLCIRVTSSSLPPPPTTTTTTITNNNNTTTSTKQSILSSFLSSSTTSAPVASAVGISANARRHPTMAAPQLTIQTGVTSKSVPSY
ncbi:hypothetical protein HDU76_011453, partial [Blyttiomyces sp. JEL0837]